MNRFFHSFLTPWVSRELCCASSSFAAKNKNVKQQIKLAQKFLGATKEEGVNRSKDGKHSFITPSGPVSTGKRISQSRKHNLSKVFFDKIVEIVSTTECDPSLSGYGLEFLKVDVTADLSQIQVYWVCGNPACVNFLDGHLQNLAPSIRQSLIHERVIGLVPPIKFIPDRKYYQAAEVERRLALADFGPDFIPMDRTHNLKSSYFLEKTLDPKIWNEIDRLSVEDGEPASLAAVAVPDIGPLRQDIMGVNRTRIMDRIHQVMKVSKAEHRLRGSPAETPVPCDTYLREASGVPPQSTRTEAICKWSVRFVASKANVQKKLQWQLESLEAADIYQNNFAMDLSDLDEPSAMPENFHEWTDEDLEK